MGAGVLKATAAALSFGLFSVWIELEYRAGANLGGTVLLRLLGTLPLALVIWRSGGLRRLSGPPLMIVALIAVQGATGVLYIGALGHLPPADVVTVVYVYPALTFLGALALGWTRPSVGAWVAVLTCCLGVLVAVGGPSGSFDLLGTSLAAGSAVTYAVGLLLTQRLLVEQEPLLLAATVTLGSGVAQGLGFALLATPVLPGTTAGWLAGVGTGLLSTTLAYLLLYSAIGRIGASVASIVCCLELVTAIAAAGLLLGDPIGLGTVAAAGLIALAVVLAGRASRSTVREFAP